MNLVDLYLDCPSFLLPNGYTIFVLAEIAKEAIFRLVVPTVEAAGRKLL